MAPVRLGDLATCMALHTYRTDISFFCKRGLEVCDLAGALLPLAVYILLYSTWLISRVSIKQ